MAAQGSFRDTGVDDVGRPRPGGQRADRAGLLVVEWLDIAANQQSGQERLAATSLTPNSPRGSWTMVATCSPQAPSAAVRIATRVRS